MSRSLLGLATESQRPNLHYEIADRASGRTFLPPANTGWRYARSRMQELIDSGCVLFPQKPEGRAREKKFRGDLRNEFVAFETVIDAIFTSHGSSEIRSLFGEDTLEFAKPSAVIRELVRQAAGNDGIVCDFFAGSGTTSHAVLDLNAQDGGNRRFILVQLPEPTGREDYFTIADIAEERVRRVIRNLDDADASKLSDGDGQWQDRGFRVFKLGQSNVKEWDVSVAHDVKTVKEQLALGVDHLRHDRSDLHMVYEVLLKSGYPLSAKVATEAIDGRCVYSVSDGGPLDLPRAQSNARTNSCDRRA